MVFKSKKGDIAENALVVANIDRFNMVKDKLSDIKLVNDFMGYYTYTGFYENKRLTLSWSGIGNTSLALDTLELYKLGAKNIIRFGSTVSINKNIKPGSYVLPVSYSHNNGGLFNEEIKEDLSISLSANYDLLKKLDLNLNNYEHYITNAFTTDSQKVRTNEFIDELNKLGIDNLDMEGSALYLNSKLYNFKALSVLTAYSNLITGESLNLEGIRKKEEILFKIIVNSLE